MAVESYQSPKVELVLRFMRSLLANQDANPEQIHAGISIVRQTENLAKSDKNLASELEDILTKLEDRLKEN